MLDSSRNRSSPRSFPSYQLQLSTSANSPSLPPPTKVILKPNLGAWFGHRRDDTRFKFCTEVPHVSFQTLSKPRRVHTTHAGTVQHWISFQQAIKSPLFLDFCATGSPFQKITVAHFSVHAASWVLTHRQLAIQIWNSEIFHLVQSSIHPQSGLTGRQTQDSHSHSEGNYY